MEEWEKGRMSATSLKGRELQEGILHSQGSPRLTDDIPRWSVKARKHESAAASEEEGQ